MATESPPIGRQFRATVSLSAGEEEEEVVVKLKTGRTAKRKDCDGGGGKAEEGKSMTLLCISLFHTRF